ncbi:S9 family peptidase [Virgibacillus pantothenticus]|uniref:S9 family peptidase n=3 Tax=Virgibacillus pantothenticus TaxID=1473 RepID=UPI0025AFD11E|nr:alpha/beta fold hydrolase [Virgibacillus pantothenticus]
MISFPQPTVEQFFRTYAITNFTVTPDEKRVIFSSNLNGKMNVWAMDLPKTFPYLFAHHDESCSFLKCDPENRYVLAGFDKDGDENHQIYAIPPEGGLPQALVTGYPQEKYFFAHLSEDGERLYYITSEGNSSFLNTRIRHLQDEKDTLLHVGEAGPTVLEAVSEQEKAFVFTQMYANTYITGFVKIGEEQIPLTPDNKKIHVVFDPVFVDETTIYFLTDYEDEYTYLAKFDIDSLTFCKVLAVEQESINFLKWNKQQQCFYFVTEKGVMDRLYRYNLAEKELITIKAPLDTVDHLVVPKSGNLYVLGRTATSPANIYQYTYNDESWTMLTNNRVLGVASEEMVVPEVVTYSSYDGMEIEALLFKAHAHYDNGYTIFWPHGGPQAAERKEFRSMFQALLNRGYSIFAPNFRGSTGYGASFVKMVEQDWGEGPRLDCLEGIHWLFNNGITSKDKLFLVGGSYGGYMALLLHGRHADYFKAVVDIFGPSDLFTFVKSVPAHWKPIMERWLGDPERDEERFMKDSPITYLDGMTKPMLVIQGAKDPRVVKAESDQIVAKLREKGREVEYLVLEDEGHGFSKKENEIKVYQRMLDFLDRHQDNK